MCGAPGLLPTHSLAPGRTVTRVQAVSRRCPGAASEGQVSDPPSCGSGQRVLGPWTCCLDQKAEGTQTPYWISSEERSLPSCSFINVTRNNWSSLRRGTSICSCNTVKPIIIFWLQLHCRRLSALCISAWGKWGRKNSDHLFYSFLGFINHQKASNTSCRVWIWLLCSRF